MNILLGCECSGIFRDAFIALGHNAVSCDIKPSERPGPHIRGDVRKELRSKWDMMIAFPDCSRLCVSGARWKYEKEGWEQEQEAALDFVLELMNADIYYIALENPIGIISSRIEKPTQIVQPWWFGHPETKALCLWLQNLPPLECTKAVEPTEQRVWKMGPGPNRKTDRGRSYPGMARAAALQWGKLPPAPYWP